jgi:hypothetical protein
MPESFFYFEKPRVWDIVTIVLYLLLTAVFCFDFHNEASPNRRDILSGYAFVTQVFLICVNYRSLRNMTVYCVWMAIALGHFLTYLYLLDYIGQQHFEGLAANGLRNTTILLLIFQGLRLISINTQGQEFIFPRKNNLKLLYEREGTFIDLALVVIYFLSMLLLSLF